MKRWSEGAHWQIDGWPFAIWIGFDFNRWMLGVVLNTSEGAQLGVGIGPLYFGLGLYA